MIQRPKSLENQERADNMYQKQLDQRCSKKSQSILILLTPHTLVLENNSTQNPPVVSPSISGACRPTAATTVVHAAEKRKITFSDRPFSIFIFAFLHIIVCSSSFLMTYKYEGCPIAQKIHSKLLAYSLLRMCTQITLIQIIGGLGGGTSIGGGEGGIKLLYPPISNYLVVHIAELSLSWLVDHSSQIIGALINWLIDVSMQKSSNACVAEDNKMLAHNLCFAQSNERKSEAKLNCI